MTAAHKTKFHIGDVVHISSKPETGLFVLISRAPSVLDRKLCSCGKFYLNRFSDHGRRCKARVRTSGAWWLQNLSTGALYRPDGIDVAVFPTNLELAVGHGGPLVQIESSAPTGEA